MAQVNLPPGFVLVDDAASSSGLPPGFEIAEPDAPPESYSGAASAALGGARVAPAAGRSVARFAANHPAATQKVLGAGVQIAAGSAGAAAGGAPGALIGASIRGATPTQAGIRETAGRLAGEAPEIAKSAGRAQGVINYAKEVPGLKLTTQNLMSTGQPSKAVDNFADSMGQRVIRIFDPSGNVVVGPEAAQAAKRPGVGGRLLSSAARGAGMIGKALSAVSGPVGMTDFAQTVEPERRDIGVMGIGRSQPTPEGADLEQLNTQNTQAMQARLAAQAQQQAAVRQRILSMLGLDR